MTQWEIVVGLEVHAQLSTLTKIFSGASTAFGAEPNTQACAVDLALPGVLPVLNRGAVERAIRLGLAINAPINRHSVFARKNYFYPDLPKGYQISQMDEPIVQGGSLLISTTSGEKLIRITRAHLEEDAGKSLHGEAHGLTGIDLNRAGVPLLEIVSEPDLRSAAEAVAYARTLHNLVMWLDICDGNMQEGSFRCDANVSVRPVGSTTLGTRCEIKNLNSFRFLERAIDYEARRQIELLEEGSRIRQETRLYDADKDETRTMRSKEDAFDYRYFPDPDLLPVAISDAWIARTEAAMPELPWHLRARLVEQYGLSDYDAGILTSVRVMAEYFEQMVRASGGAAKQCANWMTGELLAALNRNELAFSANPISADQLGLLILRVQDGTVSGKLGKTVFEALWQGEGSVDEIIAARGLRQVSDSGAISAMIAEVLAKFPAQVAEYRAGKEKMLGFLVGQVMKASQGKANPQQLNEMLIEQLGHPSQPD
jgi:aspartyl-tRNA(Asn)/glutamyl-tRNA(Gln) amidotransferase subunit B